MICSYCNSEFEGKFCPNCGAPAPEQTPNVNNTPVTESTPATNNQPVSYPPINEKRKIRRGMKTGMIICWAFAGLYALVSIGVPSMISMTLFFSILGVMFLFLGISPKKSKYMFGKTNGLKKGMFVLISIIIAFTTFGVLMGIIGDPTTTTNGDGTSQVQDGDADLEDIENWYNNQTSTVSQSLMEYSKSVKGLTSLNVNSSQFRFGEDFGYYDCHYTFYFTCKVNGVNYDGEARAFMKYQDSTVNWFHFEIFSNDGIQSIVEHYDDSYDKIIEDYYKELESTYN